jgi:peptide/nickel transport system substrate-binding protein
MSGVYGQKAYDLTIISHVEPLDFGNFARPNYYWGYESAEFNALWAGCRPPSSLMSATS